MAEIKLSDGSVIRTEAPYDRLQAMVQPLDARFLLIVDVNGAAHFVSRDHVVYLRDDSADG